MSLAGQARIVTYVAACLLVGASALAAGEPGRAGKTAWREPLERADAALGGGDARGARRAWEEAYRAAIRARTPDGLLAVGWARVRIGEVAGERGSAMSDARRIFLVALFQARERHDADGVALAGEAFAALGDREVADRAFAVAAALAARSRDAATRERIAVLANRAARSSTAP